MQYIWINYTNPDIDEPTDSYMELNEEHMERRRVDFYQNGMRFAYGGERRQEEVLSKEAYPEDPSILNRPGEVEVRLIDRRAFEELWYQSQEWPTGFMELLP